ncbi:MAG: type II toxin-antitoxin system prevent-host-death family antitoxin [Coriobacteriia bacterium]|nr:type II toxin-antitoxin system prevent-host-death family antitoxin [Coriobacteriia bacterium]
MDAVGLYDAKANLSKLVDKAQKGVPTIITKHGKPAALVSPIVDNGKTKLQRTGFFKGCYTIPKDFDTAGQDEIIALFEGEGK